MSNEIRILDDNLIDQGRVDDYESSIMNFNHGDQSNISIKVAVNKNNADKLVIDNIIYDNEDRERPFIITEAPQSFDRGGAYKNLVGYDVFHLFTNRAANITAADIVYTAKSTEYIIKDVLSSTLSGDRAFSYITIAPNTDLGSVINLTIKPGQDLYSLIVYLLAIDKLGLYGAVGDTSLEIDVYKGADRSQGNTEGNPPVIFSVEYNNLVSGETVNSSTFAKNFAYVLGQDGSGNRIVHSVGTATGNARREVVIDGGDESDTTALEAMGLAAFTENEEGATFKTSALSGSFTYGVDYFLGDFVTVNGEKQRITGVQRVREARKPEQVFLTFGQKQKDQSDQITELDARMGKVETKTPVAGGGGSSTFIELSDTPAAYTGQAKKLPRVNTAANALEFKDLGEIINDTTAKTTPADADTFGGADSAASSVLKKFSWANIKATILSWLVSKGFCIRETLTEDRTYFIKPGSGAVSGSGTLADPFTGEDTAVLQYVFDLIGKLDISIYTVIVDLYSATGTGTVTYTLSVGLTLKSPLGSGNIYIIGNPSNQDSVIIDANGNSVFTNTPLGQTFVLKNFQMYDAATTGYGLLMSNYGYIELDGIHFNGIRYPARAAINGARIGVFNRDNATKITGSPSFCFWVNPQGELFISDGTLDTTALTSFNYFYLAENLGLIRMSNSTNYTTTAIPGQKWYVLGNAVLDVNANTVPGNTAGVPAIGTSPYGGQVR
jgi:hypothetical protein